jgi:AbrB family looped-hinge helix DNA binding protein
MRVAIDKVGRIVIPKPMRDALGISGPTELELTVPYIKSHLEERDGHTVIVPDQPVPPLTTEMVPDVLERVRK